MDSSVSSTPGNAEGSSPSNTPNDQGTKVKDRVAIACLACRQRRHKCSGGQPCTQCHKMRREDECVYQPSRRGQNQPLRGIKRNRAGQQVQQASEAALEAQRQAFHASLRALDLPDALPPFSAQSSPIIGTQAATEDGASSNPHSSAGLSAVRVEALDGVGMATNNPATADERPYIGESAALRFFDFLRARILTDPEEIVVPAQTLDSETHTMVDSSRLSMPYKDIQALPPRDIADGLIRFYLDLGQGVFPIFHEETFLEQYNAVWLPLRPGEPPPTLFYAVLNLAFAIGSLFANASIVGEKTEAETFASRARRILASQSILSHGSLLGVQALVLLAQYSQSRMSSSESWNALGLAARTAIALGFHVEPPAGMFPDITAELRRRVWWMCFSFDISMSTIFGRPSMVAAVDATAALPSALPTEYVLPVPRCSLFSSTCTLYQLSAKILAALYRSQEVDQANQLKSMIELERELEAWRMAIPDKLRYGQTTIEGEPMWLVRHRNILHSRYLHARILLFRPGLARSFTQEAQDPSLNLQLSEGAWQTAADVCLDTAQQIIEVCHAAPSESLLGSSSWYELSYLFSACSVLLASRWRGNHLESIDASYTKATAMLRRSRPSAASALDALKERLSESAPTTGYGALAAELESLLGTVSATAGMPAPDAPVPDMTSSNGWAEMFAPGNGIGLTHGIW